MSAYITVTWGYRRQCMKVKTFCTECNKKLTRVVERGYYDNGFHNPRETHNKNWEEIKKEAAKLEKKGTVCKTCIEVAQGVPTFRKIKDGTAKYRNGEKYTFKRWEIITRDKQPKQLGIVREYDGGWAKFLIEKPKDKSIYRYQRSITGAATEIAKFFKLLKESD